MIADGILLRATPKKISQMRILSFEVETKYEYTDKNRYKRYLDGYEYEHTMKVGKRFIQTRVKRF